MGSWNAGARAVAVAVAESQALQVVLPLLDALQLLAVLSVGRRAAGRGIGGVGIVLGVQQRPSEAMPFGALAHGMIEGADQSLVLVLGREDGTA